MALSAVAGIVDQQGGLRVVVTQRWRMRYHVGKKERLFVVPGVAVQEPVPWEEIPALIDDVHKHVVKMTAPTNNCGDCRACCELLFVKDADFEKPSGKMCENACSIGCKIYWRRPSVCKSFECAWLKSQSRNDRMTPELRPDRCGAIFSDDTQDGNPLVIECHGKPDENAWRWINEMQAAGYRVRNITHYVGEETR